MHGELTLTHKLREFFEVKLPVIVQIVGIKFHGILPHAKSEVFLFCPVGNVVMEGSKRTCRLGRFYSAGF